MKNTIKTIALSVTFLSGAGMAYAQDTNVEVDTGLGLHLVLIENDGLDLRVDVSENLLDENKRGGDHGCQRRFAALALVRCLDGLNAAENIRQLLRDLSCGQQGNGGDRGSFGSHLSLPFLRQTQVVWRFVVLRRTAPSTPLGRWMDPDSTWNLSLVPRSDASTVGPFSPAYPANSEIAFTVECLSIPVTDMAKSHRTARALPL